MANSLKRKMSMEGNALPAKKLSMRPAGHWSAGLTASMDDPNLKVDEDDKVIIIKDKYPKVGKQ